MSHRAALDIASDAARDAVSRFGLSRTRVWLVSSEATAVLAASSSAQTHIADDGMRQDQVLNAIDLGPLLQGNFMGLPLRSNVNLGYLECYSESTISFADAAGIDAWAKDLSATLASASATTQLESPARGHVVLADDDASIRKLLQTLLTRNGFTVTAVENGLLACEAARQHHPDLVLLDWMMPVLDGRSAVARLKNDPVTRDIPVVMLTSQARTEDKVSALEAGAQDYLTKPFDSRELVARIEQQLRWRKLLADDEVPRATVAPQAPLPANDTNDPAPPPPNGDYWSAAVQAQQVGKYRHALSYYVQEAENCDASKQYARAAIAFRSASAVAGQLQNLDLSNKFLRLSGKMYLCWAENTDDGKAMQEAYVNAARCFLSAGNLKLARKSVEIAESMHAVIGDDRPSRL